MYFHTSLIFLSSIVLRAAASDANPTVTIGPGLIVGTTTAVPSARATVNKFLGIPFAVSPPERFSPPTEAEEWTEPLNATTFRDACIQQFNYPQASDLLRNSLRVVTGAINITESEDCLYLNVYAPSTPPPEGGRAVIFWLYGGNLQNGAASLLTYDGTSFAANQDVIVVTIGYRTNVFGFSNAPEVPPTERNPGFLDQRFALSWVQRNIASFGGNPDKVTIFGESAGGSSVKQLFVNPPVPLPFRAAIMQSEAVQPGDPESGLAAWKTLVKGLNCSGLTSELACVRRADAKTIKAIIEHGLLFFPPTPDNVTASRDVAVPIVDRTAAQVPILVGSTSQEGRLQAYVTYSGNTSAADVAEFLEKFSFPGITPELAAKLYAPADGFDNAFDTVSGILTDSSFLCPSAEIATLASLRNYKTWRYIYDATFPDLSLFPESGAYHGSELPIVFGTYPRANATRAEVETSRIVQTAWAEFAKDPEHGLSWPMLGTNAGREVEIIRSADQGNFTDRQAERDKRCWAFGPYLSFVGV